MTNHPNRGWRSRWSVDLETATATHRDGWVFKFSPATDGTLGAHDGQCIAHPEPLTQAHAAAAIRIASEAGDIYVEAREGRH